MGPCGENVLKIYFSGTTEPFEKNFAGIFLQVFSTICMCLCCPRFQDGPPLHNIVLHRTQRENE
jgi:hypothetical protein